MGAAGVKQVIVTVPELVEEMLPVPALLPLSACKHPAPWCSQPHTL